MKRKLITILALFCIVTTTFIGCGKKEEVKEESKIEANADESNLKENNKEDLEKQQEEEKGNKEEENKKNKEEDIKSNGDKDSINKPTDTPNKPNGASNGNSGTPSKPNPSKPKPTPPPVNPEKPNPNPDKPKPPVKPNPPKPPVKPNPPKPPVKPDLPKEKVYTGRQAVQTLHSQGYPGESSYATYSDGSMEVMIMEALSGKWDMIYLTQSFDTAYTGHHKAFCNAMMPGYGGNLYNLLKSNKNQTTKLGGRTVQVVIEPYGVKLRISPING